MLQITDRLTEKVYRVPEDVPKLARDLYARGVKGCTNDMACIIVCEYYDGNPHWSIDDPVNFNSVDLEPDEFEVSSSGMISVGRVDRMIQDIRVLVYTKYKDDYELTVEIEKIASRYLPKENENGKS